LFTLFIYLLNIVTQRTNFQFIEIISTFIRSSARSGHIPKRLYIMHIRSSRLLLHIVKHINACSVWAKLYWV